MFLTQLLWITTTTTAATTPTKDLHGIPTFKVQNETNHPQGLFTSLSNTNLFEYIYKCILIYM